MGAGISALFQGGNELKRYMYEIRVEGHLGDSWVPWFEGLAICHTTAGETVLTGPLPDEAALHGVLIKIRDLGLRLVAVNRQARNDL
jgi:hypothetical protein